MRNAEVAFAMGMVGALSKRWRSNQDEVLHLQTSTSSKASFFSGLTKTLNPLIQSAAITTGAVLAIYQEISPGVMIGAAMLLGKTIQPIQQAVSGWRSFVEAKEQYGRLNDLLTTFPPNEAKMSLPPIEGRLSSKASFVIPPGGETAVLSNVSYDIPPGTVTMVLGASAAGKSTLVRAMLGLWPTAQGEMRIDGAEAHHIDRDEVGANRVPAPRYRAFDGSVAENISRFGK